MDWGQRAGDYGFYLERGKPRIWIHAVSVGEVMAAVPILKELYDQDDTVEVVLSVTTSSGHQTAREKASGYVDHLIYFPIDVPRFVMNALVRVKPTVVAMMETELWMNFLTFAKSFHAKTFIINGRISDRSFPRAMKLRSYYRALLSEVDEALMQTEVDRERLLALGASQAEVIGNSKFDEAAKLRDTNPAEWRAELGIPPTAKVVVIGSTRGREEHEWALSLVARPDWEEFWVVHAPRHLEDCDALEASAQKLLGTEKVARRSLRRSGRYLILDSYGELGEVYSVADVALVGGSFLVKGGQNMLQPLSHGVAVVTGPATENFRDIVSLANRAGAIVTCQAEEVGDWVVKLMDDEEQRNRMGHAAKKLITEHQGSSAKTAAMLLSAAREQVKAQPKKREA